MVISSSLPFNTTTDCPQRADRYFDIGAVIASLMLNWLFLSLIRNYTSLAIRPYKRLLLVCCGFDVTATIFSGLVFMTVNVVKHGQLLAIFDGPIPYLLYVFNIRSNPILVVLFFIREVLSMCLCGYGPLPFFYRYLLICKNRNLSNRQLLLFVTIIIFMAILASVTHLYNNLLHVRNDVFGNYWEQPKFECLYVALDYGIQFEENDKVLEFFYNLNRLGYILMVIFVCSYILSAYFAVAIIRFLRSKEFLPETMRNNKQINWTLFIQGVTPILVNGIPYAGIAIFRFTGCDCGELIIHWMSRGSILVPCINPLMTMLLLSCYRRVIFEKIGGYQTVEQRSITH